MDVLFLCHRIPYPPNRGDKIRSHALLAHLAKRHRVHVACFVDDPADLQYRSIVKEIAGGECLFVQLRGTAKWLGAAKAFLAGKPITVSSLDHRAIHKWIAELAANYHIDRTVVFSSGMASYLLNRPELEPSLAIVDMVDVDSDKWRQYAEFSKWPQTWLFRREAEKLLAFERSVASRVAATGFVSEFEAATFAAVAPESAERILVVPNGVDLNHFTPGISPSPFNPGELPVVMTGRMDYRPNVDAAEWFVSNVLPRLKQIKPTIRFYAVGANPPAAWRNADKSDVTVAERVEDVRPYIQHAAAIVAPLRIARGVQNKVLEAMAMAKSVVATHEATRALSVTSGVELLIENDPSRFADAVLEAIRRCDLGQNARRYVEQFHDWRHNLLAFDQRLDCLGNDSVAQMRSYMWPGASTAEIATIPDAAE